jgi:integrase
MKITKRLTEEAIINDKRYKIWDDQIKGLALEVFPSGIKTFQFFYRTLIDKKFTYIKIGNYPDISCEVAREISMGWRADLARRLDPKEVYKKRQQDKAEEERKKIKFSDFLDIYLERHVNTLKASTIRTNTSRINILKSNKRIGVKLLDKITQEDIIFIKKELVNSPVQFNRLKEIIGSSLTQAMAWGYLDERTNPCKGVKSYKEYSRKVYLNIEEVNELEAVLLEHAKKSGSNHAHCKAHAMALLLILFTGCRHGEVRGLTWDEVSLREKCLNLKDSKTGSKTIPLNDKAINILKSMKRVPGNKHVFVGKLQGKSLHRLQDTWKEIRVLLDLEHVTIHDLRHTFASLAIKAKVPLYNISKLLGHSNISTTMRYAHLEQDELIKDSNKISDMLGG